MILIGLSSSLLLPKSPRDIINNNIITSSTTSIAILSSLILPTVANADGKLEYQPALQGLDYGKPRYHFHNYHLQYQHYYYHHQCINITIIIINAIITITIIISTFYPDFIQKPSGLQYKIVKEGDGKTAAKGDRVVIDWEGYTIGYYGRPFQVRNKVKGGAFDSSESDNFRWVVGSGTAIAAIDEGVQYIKEGGIAQIIVPAELGYPIGDTDHDIVGPKPGTFSGLRALNFVLDNKNLIDKTLLINVKVLRVDKNFESRKG